MAVLWSANWVGWSRGLILGGSCKQPQRVNVDFAAFTIHHHRAHPVTAITAIRLQLSENA